MAGFDSHVSGVNPYMSARVGSYEHKPEGCYLSVFVGEDNLAIHADALAVLERLHDMVGQAIQDYRHQRDDDAPALMPQMGNGGVDLDAARDPDAAPFPGEVR